MDGALRDIVNDLAILDQCPKELRPRGCEGLESGPENKCGKKLFCKFAYESYLLLKLR